jgi:predicted DNA-binding protein YlxM (UPF0122 family)
VLGYSAKEIAKVLALSHRTVEDHLQNAKDKLGCSKKSEIIQIMLTRNSISYKYSAALNTRRIIQDASTTIKNH